ncbi:MAG TPA: voltage-gated chloride channel family protein [Acidimicrobiales bacterium]|nr:voltage-gated chloride channel family protein [Acidimicrobiales bacterium]
MRHRFRSGGIPSPTCARCTLPSGDDLCRWCGHNPADLEAVSALDARRGALTELRRDRTARRKWLASEGRPPFLSCPACRQRTEAGLCEHCHFDTTDDAAIAALADAARERDAARATDAYNLAPKRSCPRCWLPQTAPEVACDWCGHDPADATQATELAVARQAAWERRRRLARDRRDRRDRQAERAANVAAAFMTCVHCSQWGSRGMCQWCDFDNDDTVAVAANEAARAAHRSARRGRWAELRSRMTPPSRRAVVPTGTAAPRPAARFMTCPSCHQWSPAPVCEWCAFDTTDTDAVHHLVEEHLFAERRWEVRRQRAYSAVRGLLRVDVAEQGRLVAHLVRWIVLGVVVGVLAGGASAGFLTSLTWATRARDAHPWLLFGLPVAGFVVGLAYHYGGGRSAAGNNLIIDEIHDPQAWVPRRMAPLVFLGTVATHLFGGSAGREGTAIQMSGSLTDGFARAARVAGVDRRLLLIAAIAGGFGAVFGVPLAGCVFALEVQAVGRIRYDAIVPAMTASLVGDLVVRALGVHHTPVPVFGEIHLTALLIGKVLVAGLAFGATAVLFSELTHGIKSVFRTSVRWAPARPLIGGFLVIGLTYAVGSRDYLGLSLPLITKSLAGGAGIIGAAFILKLLFTSLTLGSGFQGGEVTPLFVIGATLGATLGHVLGVPVPLLAAIGFVAVFAGATNTPLACTIMGVELFGGGPIVLLAVACIASYVVTGERGIYGTQRVATPKTTSPGDHHVVTLNALAQRRRHWLPAPARRGGDDEATG